MGYLYLTLIVGILSLTPKENSTVDALDYIATYKDLAIAEMYRTGVPASIKMAQALHESNLGKSDLAIHANNHFGIKCKKYWKGGTFYHKDDDFDENGQLIDSCFRSYGISSDSWVDHSNFLRNRSNYVHLFLLDRTNYKAWAIGLQKAGYATDKAYAQKIINKIEAYGLAELDMADNPFKKINVIKAR